MSGEMVLGALNVPAQMVVEIALGMDDPFEIAQRYGYDADQYNALCNWDHFNHQVLEKRAELKASGHTFRAMAGWMAEDLAKKMYTRASMADATLPQIHEVVKTLAKLADLEPKPAANANVGTGFVININLADTAKPQTVVLDNGN